MKYKDFEGTIQALVDRKLDEIEEMEGVKILHAVESGSRAWGFASPDSDYDVRFVYVRPEQYYLRLDEKKDFINWELDETLDINGWDLSKTLQHFHKSNASLYEWGNSPVVYRTMPEWGEIKAVSERFFSCKAGMYHYYGTARKNFIEYLQGEDVKYKKYFYVLRPILACKWIEERRCPPPVLFSELMGSVLEEEMKPAVDRLIELKVKTPESAAGRKIEELNGYIAEKLDEFKAKTAAMPDDRKEGWDELNSLFIRMAGKPRTGERLKNMNDNAKTDNGIRLNKYLSEAGICSRREADRLIEDGKVTVDGRTASMGMKVFTSQEITVNGKRVEGKERPVLLAVNKPRGIVCTTSDKDRAENIVEFLKYPVRIYPVGRLDKDSEGLLLMTNQGELVNRILRGRYGHEKEYLVTVDRPVTEAFIRQMRNGVEILGTRTKPCEAEITGERSFSIILTQGLNRQIRRMCEALGYQVKTLKRVRIMNVKLGNLKTGQYRELTPAEWEELQRTLFI